MSLDNHMSYNDFMKRVEQLSRDYAERQVAEEQSRATAHAQQLITGAVDLDRRLTGIEKSIDDKVRQLRQEMVGHIEVISNTFTHSRKHIEELFARVEALEAQCNATQPEPDTKTGDLFSTHNQRFTAFAQCVDKHITDYAVPQYGDAPNDTASQWDEKHLYDQISKYAARGTTNARGKAEQLRDLYKIAHYASILHHRLNTKQLTCEHV